ncbi:MAG: hypothetical protein LUG99_05480 [Lachnospiraceae bacterium]|nr:hypothetical protein [Lachnospiraceae bacterium]
MKDQETIINSKGKILRFLLLLGFLLISMSMLPAQRAEAASTKSSALKAYKVFLKNAQKSDGKGKKFALAYVNNDTIPELYYNGCLYTYKKGSVIALSEDALYDENFQIDTYYKKTGVAVLSYSYGPVDVYFYYKLTGGQLKLIMTYEIEYTLDSGGNVTGVTYSYYTDSKSLTKAAFDKKLKNLVGSKKAKTFTSSSYKNTSANRNKYLK